MATNKVTEIMSALDDKIKVVFASREVIKLDTGYRVEKTPQLAKKDVNLFYSVVPDIVIENLDMAVNRQITWDQDFNMNFVAPFASSGISDADQIIANQKNFEDAVTFSQAIYPNRIGNNLIINVNSEVVQPDASETDEKLTYVTLKMTVTYRTPLTL